MVQQLNYVCLARVLSRKGIYCLKDCGLMVIRRLRNSDLDSDVSILAIWFRRTERELPDPTVNKLSLTIDL